MGISIEKLNRYKGESIDYSNGNRDPVVSAYLLCSCQVDAFGMGHAIPLYRDHPTKAKAIAIFDLFYDKKSTYCMNIAKGAQSERDALEQAIGRYRTSRKTAQRMNFLARYFTSSTRRADGCIFDKIVKAYFLSGDKGTIAWDATPDYRNVAKDVLTPLIAAGFSELKQVRY